MKDIKIDFSMEEIGLNKKYTFDTFVVGTSNRDAFKAALDVAKNPVNKHNPFFITGGEGLGRTHLMLAIGNYILKNKKSQKVTYVTSERFTNDFNNSTHKKYSMPDLFLLDDIQFLRNKDRVKDELIGILSALYKAGKQIVITSDDLPGKSLGIKGRPLPVFQAGSIAKIKQPNIDTKIAILQKKSELENYNVPAEVLVFLANKITSNVRALESALIRVVACASLTGKKITLPLAEAILNG